MVAKIARTLLGHQVRVNLVFVPHVRVLLAPLLEGLVASQHRTNEGLFTGVDS